MWFFIMGINLKIVNYDLMVYFVFKFGVCGLVFYEF